MSRIRRRIVTWTALLALLCVTFFGSQAAYLGVGTAHATSYAYGQWVSGASITGIRAYLSTGHNFTITSSPYRDILVSQGFRAPNGACLETGLHHYRTPYGMQNSFWVADWCNGGGYYEFKQVDNAWFSKYARTFNFLNYAYPGETAQYQDETIYITMQKWQANPPCWGVYLFNYNTSLWEAQGSPNYSCGTVGNQQGWASIEMFDFNTSPLPQCTTLGAYNVLQARSLQKQTSIGGTYSYMSSGDLSTFTASASCVPSPWTFHTVVTSPYGFVLCAPAYQPNCD